MKNIIIASDHGAVALKSEIISFLKTKDCEIKDMGVNSDESVDYPDIAVTTCEEFKKGGYDFGILLCGTGIGMSIAANRFKEVRAALCWDMTTAQFSRTHNDANILCLGQRVIDNQLAVEMVDLWLKTEFEGGRHKLRVDMLGE